MSSNELDLFTADGRKSFLPGETLELSTLWALERAPSALEARLFWHTRGKGTEDVAVVATQRLDAPAAAGEHVFRFTLPDSPYSFSGRLISLLWAAELVVLPGEQTVRWEFTLGPDGREILLSSDAAGA